jgi:nucleotide-binding universal stress UspA family protein
VLDTNESAPTSGETVTTHVSPTSQQDEQQTTRGIVVGIDTRGRSVSALVWAVEEAERDGTSLSLVSVRHETTADDDPLGQHDLGALARRLTLADVDRKVVVGETVDALLHAAAGADLIAVGCRSLRPAQRMVVGSTSRAVAGWSPVPVVVVPEAWMQPSMATAPVVVGVRPTPLERPPEKDEPDREVLDFAFARAAALKVPLAVISAWDIPTVYAWSPADIDRARNEHDVALQQRLKPWRATFPQVDVDVRSVAEKADQALVEASHVAQMIVVGRHHSTALSGLLGSTARGVLRRSTRPVAVVPAGTRADLVRDLDVQRALGQRTWAPTF